MSPQQKAAEATANFVERFNNAVLFPVIYLLMSVAFLVFLYGLAEYVFGAESDQKREVGRQHMFYGIIGLAVMISAWGILNIAAGSFGLSDELRCANNPSAAGCDNVLRFPGGGGTPGGGIPQGGTPGGGIPQGGTPGGGIPSGGTPGGGIPVGPS